MSDVAQSVKPQVPAEERLDLSEKGAVLDGKPQTLNKRLYMQLLVFDGCRDSAPVVEKLKSWNQPAVLYADFHRNDGLALLTMSENPDFFVQDLRKLLAEPPFDKLCRRDDMTMAGRSYSTGREQNLEDWMLAKPRRNALNSAWAWAIWYPLRRKPEFELLTPQEQGKILQEHAVLGMTYGRFGYAADIRLACHGMDPHDNEFVLGILGADLYPLSRLIQEMRKTQQTARFIQSLGPFFVGKVLWQFDGKANASR